VQSTRCVLDQKGDVSVSILARQCTVSRNPKINRPEASGDALASMPSWCSSCAWPASSTQSRASHAIPTPSASTRAATTSRALALRVLLAVSTDSGQVIPNARTESGTPDATVEIVMCL